MVRSFRTGAWVLGAAALSAMASGCNSAPKTAGVPGLTPKTPAAATTSAVTPSELPAIKKLKDPVKVHLAYALWHEQEGNLAEARQSYDKVLEQNPKSVEATLGLARLDIALGRMDDAEKRLSKAQKLAPKNHHVAILMGQYYSARNDWPRALESMQLARKLSPYDQATAYHLGVVQAKSGDLTSALASFTEAVGAAEAQYNLAFILNEQGNLAAAEEHLQRAISLKPDLAPAQNLLLAVRKEREIKNQLAQNGRAPRPTSTPSPIQPASYTEPQRLSNFDPAPAH